MATSLLRMDSVSSAMREVIAQASRIADSVFTVLIEGETGTGKEYLADLIQSHSSRAARSYHKINCAAITESLFESELFGHEKGAFTGAHTLRRGVFEVCDGGTLLLDEVGELSPSMQGKFLRVLQDGSFSRVGGSQVLKSDVRVICATNRNLQDHVTRGLFRIDLFFRISSIRLLLPALRDRLEDLPSLLATITDRAFTEEAMNALRGYSWPGNIRELASLIRLASHEQPEGAIRAESLNFVGSQVRRDTSGEPMMRVFDLNLSLLERQAILRALDLTNWVQKDASELLGITPRALNYKISCLHLTHPNWRRFSSRTKLLT